MVGFTGGAGTVNNAGSVFEWSDVIVVVENNAIVDYFTQFAGDALPSSTTDVSIGSYNVQVTSLSYRHLGGAVGVNNLTLDGTANFTQAATNFTISGKLTNNGLMSVFADTIVTGALENNGLITIGAGPAGRNFRHMKLKPTDGDFTLSGAGDIRLRDGFVTGHGGESSITDLFNSSKISGFGYVGAEFGAARFPGDAGYLSVINTAAGTIEADVSGEVLYIQLQLTSANPLMNAGMLAASNGGILSFNAVALVEQTGAGTIKAFDGSRVILDNTTVRGGTLDGEGSGFITTGGFSTRLVDVDLSASASLNVGRSLTLEGTIENRGSILASDFQNSTKIHAGGVTLTGGGTFRLAGNFGDSAIGGEALGAVLTNTAHTILGNGLIAGANLTLINAGLISAVPDGVQPPQFNRLALDSLAGVRNTGILEANGAATLSLTRVTVDNAGGTIRALGDGAKVSLLADTQIRGGTFATDGTGQIRIEGFSVKLTDVQTLAGTSFVDASEGTVLEGAIVNRGSFVAGSIRINANDVTLSGGGTFRFTGRDGDSFIIGQTAGAVLTNSDQTILGAGIISGANLTLINASLISATPEAVVRNRLALDSLASVRNTGILEANGAATLALASTSIDNAGGTIRATGTGATVVLGRELTLTGGTLATTGSGLVRGDGQLFKLVDVQTLDGTNINLNSSSAVLEGAIVNRGSIIAGFQTRISAADVTLTGGGTLRMTGNDGDSSIVGQAAGAVLTNVNNTIFGAGVIAGANLTLINASLISATPDAVVRNRLALDSLAGVLNTGILEANGAATLVLASVSIDNAGGTIRAVGNGSTVVLGGQLTITGGTLATTGTGVIRGEGQLFKLVDVQTLAGTNIQLNSSQAVLEGAIVNRGTILGGGATRISANDATLSGGGTFRLTGADGDTVIVGQALGAVLTNVDNTIFGAAVIAGANLTLVNSGLISATQEGVVRNRLALDSLAGVRNTGILEANTGAPLQLAGVTVDNAGGTIRATGDGAVVSLGNGSAVTGGTFASTGTGVIRAEWFGGNVRLTDVGTLAGTNLDVGFGAIFEGAIVNRGTINVTQAAMRVGQTQFTGEGSVVLANGTALVGNVAGATLNNVSSTFGGAGSLGGNSGLFLVNGADGVITANQAGQTLRVETGTVVTNNGVLSANRGTLNVIDNLTGTGRLEVTNGGTLIVDQGTEQAVVFAGAAADTLSLSRREASAGGFDFTISGMGVGDRIKLDVGAAEGQEVAFTFTPGTEGATLSTTSFATGAGAPYLLRLIGDYAFGAFRLIGGADQTLGFVRVAPTQQATEGNDLLYAAVAGDRLFGLGGDDTMGGNAGTDRLEGDAGDDILFGVGGNDTMLGGAGNDILYGGAGNDSMLGGTGNDRYVVEDVGDQVVELAIEGDDTIFVGVNGFTMGPNIEIARLFSTAASITGSEGAEQIVANAQVASLVRGAGGDDVLWGGSLAHTLEGGAGDDIIRGQDGPVSMIGGIGNDSYVVGNLGATITELVDQGADTVYVTVDDYQLSSFLEVAYLSGDASRVKGSDTAEQLVANIGLASTLTGNGGNDTLWGSSLADTMIGGAGDDILRGQGGADLMTGGTGNDSYVVFSSAAVITELFSEGYDIVYAGGTGPFSIGGNVEEARLIVAGNHLIGNALGNLLVANSSGLASTIDAAGGNDIVFGTAAADTITGGTGDDIIYALGGADRLVYSAPNWGTDQVAGLSPAAGAKLQFQAGSGVTSFGQLGINSAGENTQINHANGVILLFGVASLSASDFIFG